MGRCGVRWSPPDETPAAAGEIVWSWRRDPGATLAVSSVGNGGKKGRFPGESAYKPSNHCAGKAGMSRLYLSNPCAFFHYHCTRCCGRSQRPAFPAPSVQERANERCKTRAASRRGNADGCLTTESAGSLHLAPLAGRGRIASEDAIRVRGTLRESTWAPIARKRPLTPTLSP